MRITFRLIFSLVVTVTVVVTLFAFFQVRQEKARLSEELERRAGILAESLQETVEPLLEKRSASNLQRIVDKFGNRERLSGVAVYDANAHALAITPSLATQLANPPDVVTESLAKDRGLGGFDSLNGKRMHFYALPLKQEGQLAGALVIVHDASYIGDRISEMWRHNFMRLFLHALLVSLTTLIVVRWSIVGPIAKAADWMKKLRTGEAGEPLSFLKADLFTPLTREITVMAKNLRVARAAAEEEARLREAAESVWTPERLKENLRSRLEGKSLFVISNREPYMHVRKGNRVEAIVPASGLVTALEPVLRASDGTWIAHGSGEADMDVVDAQARLRVPPEDPRYTLRRVWLSREEEAGYYYGFANEGLWPLCHIAHTRPIFRAENWAHYQSVNAKFAQAALEELEGTEAPCVLIQDYHFALLPRLIKEQRPDARVAIFWHIPWPNPESFGICPWQRELLYGMLGADLIGFHTQFHCNNFLETVDRTLESRIDWERFAVEREGHATLVKPFPISIAFHDRSDDLSVENGSRAQKETLLRELGVTTKYLGVGVDRIDYTKGILERFRGIERFLEKYPQYQGQFTFVELGAPSRTLITRYHDLVGEVEAMADRINWRFKTKEWKPIVFLKKHHSHQEIAPFYRAADVCLVTSLHDGMNLVAKEYVASRDDERGSLILSQFTGASRELRDALLVNPYDTEQMAEAIRYALEMDADEQQDRMRRMRDTLKQHNIYRWTANLVRELSQIRLGHHPTVKSGSM
ncbi:MAG: trehalose-6-phosphate synthase [Nitrospirae bacterium]|nr:trehalose-6-phosphate synthase [Nitrospirota bacterium]